MLVADAPGLSDSDRAQKKPRLRDAVRGFFLANAVTLTATLTYQGSALLALTCLLLQTLDLYGAGTKSRTRDLLITSQLLYQLSYTGAGCIIYRQISV